METASEMGFYLPFESTPHQRGNQTEWKREEFPLKVLWEHTKSPHPRGNQIKSKGWLSGAEVIRH